MAVEEVQRMILVIECVITCIIFAGIILPTQYKNPIKYIMSYPPEIRKRVESLPQYKDSIKGTEKGHILKKLIAIFIFIVLLSAVAYFSGAKTFQTAFLHGSCQLAQGFFLVPEAGIRWICRASFFKTLTQKAPN